MFVSVVFLCFQARSRRPDSIAASVLRQASKQSFQVHVDEDAEQTGHVGQTVGSQVLSVRKSDLEATNNPLKVLSSVSISIDHQMNENAGYIKLDRFHTNTNFLMVLYIDHLLFCLPIIASTEKVY